MNRQVKIGELLVRAGIVNQAALAHALEVQARNGGSLGKTLSRLHLATEAAVSAAVADGLRLEHFGTDLPEVDPKTTSLLPAEFCRDHLVFPLRRQAGALRLATADPLDYSTLQDVEFLVGGRVVAVVASETSIQSLIDRHYPQEVQTQETYSMLASVQPAGEVEAAEVTEYDIANPAKLAKDTKLPPIVRLVNLILSDAARSGASDIHVEPQERALQVRQRVDGLLRDFLKIPKEIQDATISRLKIISGMDIADRRRPQDGRCRLRIEGKRIDLRVSTLPTQFGEKVVIRLLDSSSAELTLDQMGFTSENMQTFQAALSQPQGLVLVTGPTGSGKTSTLYAALNVLRSPKNNIVTVEDPIEFQVPGVNQVQINPKAGITFAAGLRSILRQDPDIILVGEIRDRETASIAMEASQTGHLLLSTLHTNDAPATLSRLLDLGIDPIQAAAAVLAILAQRLVRKLCPACAIPQAPSSSAVEAAGGPSRMPADARWLAGLGCDQCGQTGYKGRLAIHELLPITDDLRSMITRRAPEHEIRKAARAAGMKTLMEDGILKAAKGLTTLEEVVRVAAQDEVSRVTDSRPTAKMATVVEFAPVVTPTTRERVLVVEDSPTVLTVVKYFLELEGFEVLTAEDGLKGLETAKRELPRVIVSDVFMPGMNGMEMVRALRSDPATHDTAIMLLTSANSVESEAQGLAAGADDYVLKPVEPRRLAARVRALLARSKGSRPASAGHPEMHSDLAVPTVVA